MGGCVFILVSSCLATSFDNQISSQVVVSVGGGMDQKGNCLQLCYTHLTWGSLNHASPGSN